MRVSTIAAAAVIAVSTAGLSQVADPGTPPGGNNMLMNAIETAPPPTINTAENMLDESASPPPTEPK